MTHPHPTAAAAEREPHIDTSPAVSDRVETTTCYMCACRCGIKVHLREGAIRYIEGNRDHPVNRGVLCAKGAAGIMKQNSPAKLTQPLLRTGPRGEAAFRAISWGRGAGHRRRVARRHPQDRPAPPRLFHRSRPEPGAHRLVGEPVRDSQLRRPRRLLLGQHGGGGLLHDRRLVLGIRRARLGQDALFHDVRLLRGPRFEPDKDWPRRAQGAWRQVPLRQSGAHRLFGDRR